MPKPVFADDVGLLPGGSFRRMLDASRKRPAQFEGYACWLSAAVAERGGKVDLTPVAWFNGGLFDAALSLEADDVALLQRVAALDWAEVAPQSSAPCSSEAWIRTSRASAVTTTRRAR